MSTLKFTHAEHWQRIENHLAKAHGERFAFAFTDTLAIGPAGPVVEVVDIALIDDADTEHDDTGWYVSDRALDRIHNQAITTGTGLAEFHNHRHGTPRFSPTDEHGLQPTADYVLDLLPTHPYIAGVWAESQLHCEWWGTTTSASPAERSTTRSQFDTVTVIGPQLRVLNATPAGPAGVDDRFDRQLPLLTGTGQGAVAALRVAVVGAGGTGSQILTQLAYLGFRHLLVLDDDTVELTNLNRLVTATRADLGIAKTTVTRRRLQSIDTAITVTELPGLTVDGDHPELLDVDLIIGCLDHDGPRQRLNQIAIDTRTPYLDLATGIDTTVMPPMIGGRAALILPGGPCLQCLDELDPAEVARWAKSVHQRRLDRAHGYGAGTPNPAVVYLNALTVSAAVNELITWITGTRPPAQWLDIDLIGTNSAPGTQVAPRTLPARAASCIACSRPGGPITAAS
jgi:molybdopterin/thiamine biosynthesis adenylyltransferase